MDISNMNLVELKALAFDLFVQKGNIENALKTVNDRMNELATLQTPGQVIAEVPTDNSTETVNTDETIDKSE